MRKKSAVAFAMLVMVAASAIHAFMTAQATRFAPPEFRSNISMLAALTGAMCVLAFILGIIVASSGGAKKTTLPGREGGQKGNV